MLRNAQSSWRAPTRLDLFVWHESSGMPILALELAVHVGAALRHHFFDHDDVLARMLRVREGAR